MQSPVAGGGEFVPLPRAAGRFFPFAANQLVGFELVQERIERAGLQFHRIATGIEQGSARLRPGGSLMFEFGFGQEMVAEALIAATPGLDLMEFRRDLQGLARVAIAKKLEHF